MRAGGLSAATVILREDNPGAPRLVAYVVTAAGSNPTDEQLLASLASELPDYMIPTALVRLERLPVTPNGKLDRAALPVPAEAAAAATEEFVAPQTALERRLAAIWAEVLNVPRVSATLDLLKAGADSIQLFQIIARCSREGLRLTAKQLLQHRTVRAVAALLEEDSPGPAAAAANGRSRLPNLGKFKRNARN